MKSLTVVTLPITSVICGFCGKDSILIGRHTWHCRSMLSQRKHNVHVQHSSYNYDIPKLKQCF